MNKRLIMIGYHKETKDGNGRVAIPASLFKIYDEDNKDVFGDRYMASCEQIYARRNKKIDDRNVKIDDFKGVRGIEEHFYNIDHAYEFMEMIINDGYIIKRIPGHGENELADELFRYIVSLNMNKADKVMNF